VRKITFLIMLLLCAQTLIAEQKPEETDGITAGSGAAASSELILQLTSLAGIKLGFTERFVFPFLQGESLLTKDNNIDLALTAELSPISLNAVVEAVCTPIAFFQFSTSGRIGSGWNIELFGGKAYGIGINGSNTKGKAENRGSAFDGLLWKVQAGAALQADLAAVFPGDWNHIVARSYHEVNYKGYTRAAAHESWYYEDDDGENCNGFNYYGNILIGYQLPVFLDLVAFYTEMDLYLYNTPNRGKWGDDRIRWTLSGLINFTFTKKISLLIIAQFRTRNNYQETNWQDLYYRNRTIDNSNPVHLEFYRMAAVLTYKL
jgi:hypothetical protein